MEDLTFVVATLSRAIQSLQAHEHELAPLERMKLRTLRMNLAAALASQADHQAGQVLRYTGMPPCSAASSSPQGGC